MSQVRAVVGQPAVAKKPDSPPPSPTWRKEEVSDKPLDADSIWLGIQLRSAEQRCERLLNEFKGKELTAHRHGKLANSVRMLRNLYRETLVELSRK